MSTTQKGFSLIELIITLSIIGLLTSLMVPNFSTLQHKAKQSVIKNHCHTIQLALESYYLSEGHYPEGTQLQLYELAQPLISAKQLNSIPKNPFTHAPYSRNELSGAIHYSSAPGSQTYSLTAYGPQNQQIIYKSTD